MRLTITSPQGSILAANSCGLPRSSVIQCGPSIDEILKIVEATMIQHGRKEYEMPAKIGIHPYDDVFFHAMPAYLPNQAVAGIKWIECFPRNPHQYGSAIRRMVCLSSNDFAFMAELMDLRAASRI